MLFPTQVAFGFSVWHHVFNRDGSHIFHSVLNTAKAECLTTSEVEKCRNIIGWCDEDNNPTEAQYNSRRSELHDKGSACGLKQITINISTFGDAGLGFAIGEKERPSHLSPNEYRSRIQTAAKQYFVLWDSGDRRGRLVNGADALLHLVRASLWQD
ncbi:uncharacterized protein HMPREF1541_06284, partial [Cyphellophora europaea CBS 101466]